MADKGLESDPNQEETEDFEIIEEGSEEARKLAEEQANKGADAEDDEEESDETLASGRTGGKDDESPNAHKRRRQRKRLKEKLDQKDAIIRNLQQTNKTFADRLATVEHRTGASEMAMLDKAIADAETHLGNAQYAHSQSLTQNDPNLVTQAMGDMYKATRQLEELQNLKKRVNTQRAQPPATDTAVSRNVNAFMARNTWFRPDTGDEDSLIAQMLDNKVAEAGFDPRSQEYWDELERRIKKRLPHRFKGAKEAVVDDEDDEDDEVEDTTNRRANENQQRGKSNVGGSSQGAKGGRTKVVLSAQRVQALKDAGMWEDPAKRNRMIRSYREYDRQNSSN